MKAAIFDVFGTCVDWRTSVAREVKGRVGNVDPIEFAVAWRAEYEPSMERVRSGGRGYVPLDELHHENLLRILDRFGAECRDTVALNAAWEKLDPWPDVVAGLSAMKKHLIIAPCSNGSIGLMTRLGKFANLPWDCILGAEIAKDYKPKTGVYLSAVDTLRLDAEEVVMVAAHNDDLFAARQAGLKTAFVARPLEHGHDQRRDLKPEADWDYIASDFQDLALKLKQQ